MTELCDCKEPLSTTEFQRLRRSHATGTAKVQIVDTLDDNLDGLVFFARVIEASPSSMILTCHQFVSGCRINLWVAPSEAHPRLFLEGAIDWARQGTDGPCYLGIQIIDNPITDAAKWAALMRSSA